MERIYFRKPVACFLLCCLAAAALPSCVKLPRRVSAPAENSAHIDATSAHHRVNINLASTEELERLPGVGSVLAARIVAHRERHGPFRRAEHLLVVRGVSERRFRELQHLVTAE